MNHRDVVSLLNLVYEGLFEIDDNYQPQPKLAYAYSFSNDGRKVQVTLRDDISFHNGQTLTSADVVATLDYMLELAGFDENLDSEVPVADRGLYYSTFYSIKSWEATDEQTIVFTLRRASYGSLYALTFPILPASQVAADMPAGTGPYKYDGYEQGSAIWLTANDGWWNRPPQVRYVRASIYDTAEQALNASSIALGNLLGLACDPIGGLVEAPCQNRNAIGVACAFTAAQLSLAGIKAPVPFDEAADAMLRVGRMLPLELRETALGGLATCPSVCSACGAS